MVGDVAEKYGRVYDSGPISCDLGYAGCKRVSFKRNGARHKAQGTRKARKKHSNHRGTENTDKR